MNTIHFEIQDSIAVITLDRGVTNALNLELVTELSQAFTDAQENPDVSGLVITASNEKFFSIGFDIPQLFDLPQEDFRDYYHTAMQMYAQLFTLPKPVVAAITGHAIAGGCILALCCDYRWIAAGRKLMGLNEVKLGVPVPYLADLILRDLAGSRYAREILETGEFFPSDQLLEMGLVDGVVPPGEVLPQALERARLLGTMPGDGFQAIKRNRVEDIVARASEREQEWEDFFVDCWYSPETRQQLKEAIEKF